MTPTWFENGRVIDSVPVDDRGLQYGDGLFETIAIRASQPRLWPFHADRLQTGADRMGIVIPHADELYSWLEYAISNTVRSTSGIAKLIVTRGAGERGYRYSANMPPRIIVGIFESDGHPRRNWTDGVEVRVCSTRLGSQPALAGVKSLNRLDQVLARNEWQDHSIAEGLMLDADNNVVCGTMSNVFFVSGANLVTPAIVSSGVCGVMRRHILALTEKCGISASVEPVSVSSIPKFSEIFLSNSQIGLWPVRQCEQAQLSAPGPVTRELMSQLLHSGIEECHT